MKTITIALTILIAWAGSLGAENYQLLGAKETPETGDIVSFMSLSPGANGSWLEGRQGDDDRGLAGLRLAEAGPKSVTRWRVQEQAPGIYAFQCLGFADGPAWLDGFTPKGYVLLRLSPNGVSGASWGVYREGAGFNLKCLGRTKGSRWLVAGQENGVALAEVPEIAPSLWQICVWHKGEKSEGRSASSIIRP